MTYKRRIPFVREIACRVVGHRFGRRRDGMAWCSRCEHWIAVGLEV